jgi:hypothetical protein
MAKRKKKTTRRRRRSVSGIKDIDLQGIALAVGGAVLARVATNQLAKSTNTTAQKAAPYVGLIAGIVLPMVVKNPMVRQVSLGLAAGGGVEALKAAKVISGLDMDTIHGSLNKYRSMPYRKAVNGVGQTSKSNFTGSRMSQMHTISGAANGSGSGGGGY